MCAVDNVRQEYVRLDLNPANSNKLRSNSDTLITSSFSFSFRYFYFLQLLGEGWFIFSSQVFLKLHSAVAAIADPFCAFSTSHLERSPKCFTDSKHGDNFLKIRTKTIVLKELWERGHRTIYAVDAMELRLLGPECVEGHSVSTYSCNNFRSPLAQLSSSAVCKKWCTNMHQFNRTALLHCRQAVPQCFTLALLYSYLLYLPRSQQTVRAASAARCSAQREA